MKILNCFIYSSLVLLQLVESAFYALLAHLRSGTLDKFKEAFDKALDRGVGFSMAACDYTQSYLALFDEGCAGIIKLD